ncbi:MAG: MMPL family transporter [Actinomycetota bacterium]|nr:MMPL family transporter [Actinomycetota bacterium]
MFRNLGRWCFENRVKVLVFWLVALFGAQGLAAVIGAQFNGEFEIPDSESADGLKLLEEFFPGSGGSSLGGSIVFQAEQGVTDPAVQGPMEELFAEVDAMEGVAVVSPYTPFGAQQINADGTVAFATVNLDLDIDQAESGLIGEKIAEAMPEVDGLRSEVGGAALAVFEPPESELIGIAFAIVVLILSFGSVLAMGLPIAVALAGVGTGVGLVTLSTGFIAIPDFATIIGAMIGLGVGIDYALFIVTRYREVHREGATPLEATMRAMDSAGRAVVFAGLTVVVSLLGMLLMGLRFISGLGISAAMTVAVTMIASVTLLPALIGFAQERIEVTRWRGLAMAAVMALGLLGLGLGQPLVFFVAVVITLMILLASFIVAPLRQQVPARAHKPLRDTLAYRWSRLIQARPWLFLLVGTGLLCLLAAPVLGLRLGFSDEGNYPEETTTRRAYDLIGEGFGPGFNGPLVVVMKAGAPSDAAAVQAVAAAIAQTPGVDSVSPPFPNIQDPTKAEAFLLRVIPTTSPQDEATEDLVNRLRDDVIAPAVEGTTLEANVAGAVAANIDFTAYLSRRLVVFLGAVLALSFLLLMAVFRSLLVPLKAVVMNMLSIAAAYGVVVAVFQWGWFGSISGVEPAPIEPFIPMMLFAIVFGLSMDYEVFLLSRVKEEFDRTGDARNSVADGLAATARVITAAAAIMVVVFGSFLFEDDRIVKLFGLGLSMAVLLDATLVRMLLVPATMELLGAKNWWLPRWLDRILPDLNVEGSHEPAGAEVSFADFPKEGR